MARQPLGQNFLIDKNIVRKIVRSAQLQPGETVLEIGPGRGILTEALLEASGLVVAIELDAALCARLRETFGAPWRTGLEDGQETWTWGHYRYALLGTTRTRDLVVRFDERDVVVSYSFNSSFPEDRPR